MSTCDIGLIGLAVMGQRVWAALHLNVAPQGATQIEVTAQQFAWNVRYAGSDKVFGRTDIQYIDDATNPVGLTNNPVARVRVARVSEHDFEERGSGRFERPRELAGEGFRGVDKFVRCIVNVGDDLEYLGWRVAGPIELDAMAQRLDQAGIAFKVASEAEAAERLYRLEGARADADVDVDLAESLALVREEIDPECLRELERWEAMVAEYQGEELVYHVRGREIRVPLHHETLSHTRMPRVGTPRYRSWGDRLEWLLQEGFPGRFPYTAGVFPFKRIEEETTRMFAGEGPPEQTNARFHYLAAGMAAKRLSTAFDSVTLYGEDPDERPDIYGKVGNSGVSVATLEDAKKLYSGFDLTDPATSVSMTINGPAPMILAFFMNAAIDQACEKHISAQGSWDEVAARIDHILSGRPRPNYHGDLPDGHSGLGLRLLGVTGDQVLPGDVYERIRAETMSTVRGTVQADILKEDQAQNTCIFSTEFALKMMGDIQRYFVDHDVRNFYSVSISGYHMAEAGANPITQLAFTLANGFTYAEAYRARGMDVDDFAPNFSFFFSNGMDAEYTVMGRVARRIWAIAMRDLYGAGERSQKLKYHVQTSGRSLHAEGMAFNDIRTTLQPDLQRAGQRIGRDHLPDQGDPENAIASVDTETGAILALASTSSFRRSQVDLASGQGGSGRQSGSAFKPFTLVAEGSDKRVKVTGS